MVSVMEALKSAQFLVNANGQRIAVQLSMADWETLLNWIEDKKDEAIVRTALPKLSALQQGTQGSDWLEWEIARESWENV